MSEHVVAFPGETHRDTDPEPSLIALHAKGIIAGASLSVAEAMGVLSLRTDVLLFQEGGREFHLIWSLRRAVSAMSFNSFWI